MFSDELIVWLKVGFNRKTNFRFTFVVIFKIDVRFFKGVVRFNFHPKKNFDQKNSRVWPKNCH